jgi:hypothetical protein
MGDASSWMLDTGPSMSNWFTDFTSSRLTPACGVQVMASPQGFHSPPSSRSRPTARIPAGVGHFATELDTFCVLILCLIVYKCLDDNGLRHRTGAGRGSWSVARVAGIRGSAISWYEGSTAREVDAKRATALEVPSFAHSRFSGGRGATMRRGGGRENEAGAERIASTGNTCGKRFCLWNCDIFF